MESEHPATVRVRVQPIHEVDFDADDTTVVKMSITYGMRFDGVRELLALDVISTDDLEQWRSFLQGLGTRGVRGARLMTSDAHPGLKKAIS